MATELEITKRNFYTHYNKAYKNNQDVALEDYRFLTFTEFLDLADVFSTPIVCRQSGVYKNGNWKVLGYCCDAYRIIEDSTDFEENDSTEDEDNNDEFSKIDSQLKFNWQYTIFNGFFSDVVECTKASKADIIKAINEIVRFIEKTFSNDLINDITAAKDLQCQILKHNKSNSLDRLDICIITDSIIEQENLESRIYIKSLNRECKIYYWDLKKWNDLQRSKSRRLPININFEEKEFALYDINFLERKESNNLKYYLTVFPGDLIADLYDYHNTRILESNVRVFLSANRKANKAIRTSIREEPQMFFSYNNGISATAESIIIKNDKIVQITDFQIVNGGQTTASIHYSKMKDKCSLSDVNVAVKITSLKKEDNYSSIVNRISRAANTQTEIKTSDFFANDSFLIGSERLSLKNPIQNEYGENVYYFFERMSGQYNVSRNSRGSERNIRIWEETHPKVFCFNKIEIARWYNTINSLPHISALSAEKQFTLFMEDKNFIKKPINKNRYETILGFGLLFKRARKLCGTKSGKEYPSIIEDSSVGMATTIYAMAYLNFISNGCIDYSAIYNYKFGVAKSLTIKERTQSDFDEILECVIKKCWKYLAEFGGTSVQEQTKKKDCWEYVKKNVKLPDNILKEINRFTISKNEKNLRDSDIKSDEDFLYFKGLDTLFSNNAQTLQCILAITQNNSDFIAEKSRFKNQIFNLSESKKEKPVTHEVVQKMMSFYEYLNSGGFDLNKSITNNNITLSIDFMAIYNLIFKNQTQFWGKMENYILSKIESDTYEEFCSTEEEINFLLYEDGEYYKYPGFSMKQLERIQEIFREIGFL